MEATAHNFKSATPAAPDLVSATAPAGSLRLELSGNWSLAQLDRVERRLRQALAAHAGPVTFVLADVAHLDTAGALLLHCSADSDNITEVGYEGGSPAMRELLDAVASAHESPDTDEPSSWGFADLFLHVGRNISEAAREFVQLMGFVGEVLVNLLGYLRAPRRLRIAPTLYQFQEVGIESTPIIALLSFMVGAVIAFLGAQIMRAFGAEIFVVELVGYAFLREFGVVLTAIMIAGRSGSAFTAQIGAMKVNEEVDAMETIGVRAMDALVIPRVLGLLLAMPLLVFIADIFGILGGMMVSWAVLDISPGMFLVRFATEIPIEQFWVGLFKAPFFALVIALIGCMQGLLVTGSARSVGENTTKAVVQAIFLVIVLDALFAMFFLEIDI